MANVEKKNLKDSPRLLSHCNRTQKNQGSHIDKTRTSLNFNLCNRDDLDLTDYQYLKKKINEPDVYKMNRDDLVTTCSWAVSLPKDLCHKVVDDIDEDKYHFEPNDDKECRDFFKHAYDFLAKKHGEKNVVSAYVHMDENVPHMHFIFTPIVQDKKRDGRKVCAKEALSDCYNAKFQISLQDYISEKLGYKVQMVSKETEDYERNVKELKKKTLNEKYKKLSQQINQETEKFERLKRVNDSLDRINRSDEKHGLNTVSNVSKANGYVLIKDYEWDEIEKQLKLLNKLKTERNEIYLLLQEFKDKNQTKEINDLQKKVDDLTKKNNLLNKEIYDMKSFLNNTEINGIKINELYENKKYKKQRDLTR